MTNLPRRSLPAAILACALLAGACGPINPLSRPAPREWTAESPPGEVARWVERVCRGPFEDGLCVERNLVALVGQAGIGHAMEVLDTLMLWDGGVRTHGHELAHGMGLAAYESPETMHAAFAACPAGQGAGCQHGVIQGYFLALAAEGRAPGTAELDALCAPHRDRTFLYGQCAHGMGHGLMAILANHVPRSLRGCDLASDPYVRESCYSGVFMENIVVVTHPHNTTGGHGATQGLHGAGEGHGGHGASHGHGAADEPWRPLDPADPLYPCTAVGEAYQPACYVMQTGLTLHLNGGDVADAGRACERAPAAMVPVCFGSLGRDVMALAEMDHGRSLAMCGRVARMAGGRGELWCMLGVVQNLVNLAATADEGMGFCRRVSGSGHKEACYRAVGEQMLTLLPGEAERGRACEAAETPFVAACRGGARLPQPEAAEADAGRAPSPHPPGGRPASRTGRVG